MNKVQWGIPSAVFSLVFTILVALAVAQFTTEILKLPPAQSLLWSLTAQTLTLLLVPFYISYKKGNGPKHDFGLQLRKSDIKIGIGYGFFILVVALVIATVQMSLTGEFTSAAATASAIFNESWELLLVFIFLVAIVGPFVEEVAFRGMWFTALERKFNNQKIAIVGSAIVFSLIHLEIERVFLIFITGLILGYLRSKTRSLGAPIIAHMVNNTPGALGFLILTTSPLPI
jgi:uncharacterized protein